LSSAILQFLTEGVGCVRVITIMTCGDGQACAMRQLSAARSL